MAISKESIPIQEWAQCLLAVASISLWIAATSPGGAPNCTSALSWEVLLHWEPKISHHLGSQNFKALLLGLSQSSFLSTKKESTRGRDIELDIINVLMILPSMPSNDLTQVSCRCLEEAMCYLNLRHPILNSLGVDLPLQCPPPHKTVPPTSNPWCWSRRIPWPMVSKPLRGPG